MFMSIYDEIEAKKRQLQKEQQLKNKKIEMALVEAEKVIPEIVNRIKGIAIHKVATNSSTIYRRGFLGRVKYIQISYTISQDSSGKDLKTYLMLYEVKNNQRIYQKIASAINAAGFCNTKVSYYEPRCYFYISTELNLT